MIVSGIDEKSSKRIIDGKKIPDKSEINKLANIFCVSSTKLKNIISNSSSKEKFILTSWDLARSKKITAYNYKILQK